jgi:hypothetical protein
MALTGLSRLNAWIKGNGGAGKVRGEGWDDEGLAERPNEKWRWELNLPPPKVFQFVV